MRRKIIEPRPNVYGSQLAVFSCQFAVLLFNEVLHMDMQNTLKTESHIFRISWIAFEDLAKVRLKESDVSIIDNE